MTLAKALFLMVLLVGVGSLAACETIGPLFGQYKNTVTRLISVNAAGTYTVEIAKNGKVLYNESWTCRAVEGKLPVCHMDNAQTLSTDVVAPGP